MASGDEGRVTAAVLIIGDEILSGRTQDTNLRDIARSPPVSWTLERKRAYFDWAREVVDGLRGRHARLEALFDDAYSRRP